MKFPVQTQATIGPHKWLVVDDWTLCVYRASHEDQNTIELTHVCYKSSSSISFLLMRHVHLDVLLSPHTHNLTPNSFIFPAPYLLNLPHRSRPEWRHCLSFV